MRIKRFIGFAAFSIASHLTAASMYNNFLCSVSGNILATSIGGVAGRSAFEFLPWHSAVKFDLGAGSGYLKCGGTEKEITCETFSTVKKWLGHFEVNADINYFRFQGGGVVDEMGNSSELYNQCVRIVGMPVVYKAKTLSCKLIDVDKGATLVELKHDLSKPSSVAENDKATIHCRDEQGIPNFRNLQAKIYCAIGIDKAHLATVIASDNLRFARARIENHHAFFGRKFDIDCKTAEESVDSK